MNNHIIKALMLSLSLWASHARAETITLSADATLPPFDYLDAYGEVTGFSSDVLKAAAAKVGLDVKVYNQPWAEIFATIESGSRDAVSNVYVSEERKQKYFITEPYYAIEFIGVMKSDREVDGLNGMTFAVLKNSLANDVVDAIIARYPGSQKLVTSSDFLSFKALFTGKADFAVGQDIVFEDFIERYSDYPAKTVSFYPQFPQARTETAFALMKEKAYLGERINQGLAAIKNDGTYDRLLNKYFSREN